MTVNPTTNWQKAIERAIRESVKATRHADGTFTTRSVSNPDIRHTITVDESGHIAHCDCKGWERYGRSNPCKHAGAVAIALSAIRGYTLEPVSVPAPIVESFRPARHQIYRTAA